MEKSNLAYLQILGNGVDVGVAAPSVMLFFEKRRYLFNCSEGFQRYIMEHRIPADKLNSILMTRPTTDATGGLAGFLLTMSANSVTATTSTELVIRGPPKIRTYVDAVRTYANVDLRNGADFKVEEFSYGDHTQEGYVPEPVEDNAFVNITPVVLRADFMLQGGSKAEDAAAEPPAKRAKTGDDAPRPFCPPVASYICELATVRGKFHPQKAQALGVPTGPLFAKLANGESVTAVNGQVVHSADVCDPASPGPIFMIVDCPSDRYLKDLQDSAVFRRYMDGGDAGKSDRVDCIVHLGPCDVVSHPDYVAWMGKFSATTKHLIVHHPTLTGSSVLGSTETLQRKLGMLDPTTFPPLPTRVLATDAAASETALASLGDRMLPGRNMMKFVLRPATRKGIEQPEPARPVLTEAEVRTLMETDHGDIMTQAGEGREAALKDPSLALPAPLSQALAADPTSDFQLVFLGTGAAQPSKYRNVSGLFLDLGAKGNMLIDCGEGSLSQLIRRYGPEGARDKLRRLKCVWISHFHADHHGGLAEVLRARQHVLRSDGQGDVPNLLVLGPRPLLRTLQVLGQVQPTACMFVDNYNTEDNLYASIGAAALKERNANKRGQVAAVDDDDEDGLFRDPTTSQGLPLATELLIKPDPARLAQVQEVMAGMGLRKLTSVRVFHCPHAFALSLESLAGWKIVYSGDTRPCPQLVKAAEGATLLVHEATFDDGLKGEAVDKKHCITKEAVRTGSEAKVYRTLLTHFSQRYPKVPKFDKSFKTSTCIAFDLMSVSLADLPHLPSLLAPLGALFKDEVPQEDKNEQPIKAIGNAD